MRTELVTTLRRQATEILKQLKKDREPILITQHGVPSAYLVDVETFETLQRRMALLEGIARGEKAIEEGRSLTHKQVKQRMSRWLKWTGAEPALNDLDSIAAYIALDNPEAARCVVQKIFEQLDHPAWHSAV